jgi:hypothetical protein
MVRNHLSAQPLEVERSLAASNEFEISIGIGEGVIFVGVKAPRAAAVDEVAYVISALVRAFASVERMDAEEMFSLLFGEENNALSVRTLEFSVSREFSDPEYPNLIECALDRLTSAVPTLQ